MGAAGSSAVDDARTAYREGDWPQAYANYIEARHTAALPPEDLAALSDAAWWLGRVDECLEAGEGAFGGYLDAGRPRDAAMMALELAVSLFLRGDETMGSGWLSRCRRLLEDLPEGAEHGYAHYIMEVEGGLSGDEPAAVIDAARRVRRIGERHADANLVALGVLGEGRALVRLGETSSGMRLLDEAMLAALREGLDPAWAGNIYCHLMAACHELADVGRARQWTDAAWRWFSELPAATVFTGICRVHRSQVHQVTGAWDQAEQEAGRVLAELADLHVASVAEAHYQIGELQRLRGNLDAAERSYASARELGRDPQPGLALLCLAKGRSDAARAGIQAALHAAGGDRLARARLCAAQVEVALRCAQLDVAKRACAELEDTAARYATSGLEAAALHGRGAVAIAEQHPEEALGALRAACRRWHEIHAPYDAARAQMLLGQSYEMLGDRDAAVAELSSARQTFEQLGAAVDARVAARRLATMARVGGLPGGLTRREAEVLAHVARGLTNRDVAAELVLSEKTIARHLSNIFLKLDVSTRTEAAAFAFEHGLAGWDVGSAGRG